MKAVRTPGTDVELTLPGAGEDRTLPAQRIQAFDPELGETEEQAHPAFASTWSFDDGERRAIANGAVLELILHGTGHPPVSLAVGNPDPNGSVALLAKSHVDAAVGFWFEAIAERLRVKGDLGTPAEVLELWHQALEETKDGIAPVDLGDRIEKLKASIDEDRDEPGGAAA